MTDDDDQSIKSIAAYFAELVEDVQKKSLALNDAEDAASDANREETACRNALDQAQKKLDSAINSFRSGAPRNSVWKRSDN